MAVATALSIANPWWAAMAVWMLGQPTRGLLLERSLAQLIGTMTGGLAAMALVWLAGGSTPLLLLALCAWLGLCCGASGLMRHQRAYGAALCGLTTAVIVVLTVGTPIDTAGFAVARMLDNVIGIAACLIVVALWNPPSPAAAMMARSRSLVCAALAHTAAMLDADRADDSAKGAQQLVAALAALEASAEDCTAGSISQRRRLKPLRGLLAALLDLLSITPALRHRADALTARREDLEQLRASLYDLAETIEAGRGMPLAIVRTATRQLRGADPLFDTCLDDLEQTLSATATHLRDLSSSPPGAVRLADRRPDFTGARLAALRGMAVSLLATAAWLASGWEPLRYFMLGTCIFTALFSSADEPAPLVRRILIGAAAAAAAAFIWRMGVMPAVQHEWLSLLLTIPLVSLAAAVQADRRTAFIGLAFNMLFAVLAQPVTLSPTEPAALLTVEIMLLAGIALSYAAYRWLIPMTTLRRRGHIHRAIRQEIAAIAERAGSPQRAARHLARLRFLILAWVVRAGDEPSTADGALAALAVGHALLRMGAMLDHGHDDAHAHWIRPALHLMSKPLADPAETAAALQGHARRVRTTLNGASSPPAVRWLDETAAHLAKHALFFTDVAHADLLMRNAAAASVGTSGDARNGL